LSHLRVLPIVEGHGEDSSIRILLQRIWSELLGGESLEVLKPIRGSRHKLVKASELGRALNLAVPKLRATSSQSPAMVLVLLDADDDLPCVLGPSLLSLARQARADADVSCVIANLEYETWFVAAAESLSEFLDLSARPLIPADPEKARQGKGWIQKNFRGPKYSETIDQPAMTRAMDLRLCRQRSLSFDKLCRELERRFQPPDKESRP
jgi:Domain of unknown function (DUF4276)